MELATEGLSRRALSVSLAGLQAGMVGALMLVGWMGLTAKFQDRSFWTFENLAASSLYGGRAIHSGFASSTAFGLALILLLYSLLGAAFASAVPVGTRRLRVTLASVLFALCWYYATFRLMYNQLAPSVALLHVTSTTIWGHVMYGLGLAWYPNCLPKRKTLQTEHLDAETPRRTDLAQDPAGEHRA